jgi:hypothetical protein
MNKEIVVLMQSESVSLTEDQMTALEEKVKEKTGRTAIVLPPGITMDVHELKTKHHAKKTAKNNWR